MLYRHFLQNEFRALWSAQHIAAEERYLLLVEAYSARILTREDDGLNAFNGILNVFQSVHGIGTYWGLPTNNFGVATTWLAPDEEVLVRRRKGKHIISGYEGDMTREYPFPSWSWIGWIGRIYCTKLLKNLTSRHAEIFYYRIHDNGKLELVEQNETLAEYEGSLLVQDEEGPVTLVSQWRDMSQTVIRQNDIPQSAIDRGIHTIVLCFWSSVLPVTVHYSHNGRLWVDTSSRHTRKFPMIMSRGVEVHAHWGQMPRHDEAL